MQSSSRAKGHSVEKYYYSAESLDSAMREYEREYCVASEKVHAAYHVGECIEGVPRFTQAVWASFYEEVLRLTDGKGIADEPIMTRVGRALVGA
jgi:hypothetical protein